MTARACRAYAALRVTLETQSIALGLCLEPIELDSMAAELVERVLPALAPELVPQSESHGSRRTGGLR